MKRVDLNYMSRRERIKYWLGGRLRPGTIGQVLEDKLITRYVVKLRGACISYRDVWKYDTPEAAMEAARKMIVSLKEELKEMESEA